MPRQWLLWSDFQGLERGNPRGGGLSPTIFNLMVGVIVRDWMRQLEEKGVDTEDIHQIVACFCADNGLTAARDPLTLQKATDASAALFERCGPKTNTTKMEAIMFVPGRIRTPLTEEAYQARMSDFHREDRKGRRVSCHVCQEEMAVGLLKSHLATQHAVLLGAGRGPSRARKRDDLDGPFLPGRG